MIHFHSLNFLAMRTVAVGTAPLGAVQICMI